MTQAAPTRAVPLLASPEDLTRIWAVERARRLRQQLGDQRAAEVPLYGGRDWHQLPPNDPRRWLALIAAAEAWRHDGDPHVIAARLDLEFAAQQRADRADWAAVREQMTRVGKMQTPDELAARRAQLPANYRGQDSA